MPQVRRATRPPRRLLRIAGSTLLASLLAACASTGTRTAGPLDGAGQLVVVTTAHWDAPVGSLRAYQRVAGRWQPALPRVEVTVGRSGTAWGLGLHAPQPGPQKREGDGRAPAGIFRIGTAFGYAPGHATGLGYAAMGPSDWCIDVPASPLYNRIVDSAEVGAAAIEGSTEPMRRDIHVDGDQRYRLGFVIAHNTAGQPGAGSCIFAHLWQAPGESTAGCTAMPDAAMQGLLDWLDAGERPVFVLLPEAEHDRLRGDWGLPADR